MKSTGEIEEWKQLSDYETDNDDMEEYPDYINFEWNEFIDAVRNGSIIPGEDGKAVVRWYPK